MEGPWRDATWAQFVKCPLENAFALDERKLRTVLGYDLLDLHWIDTCAVAYAGLHDAGIQAGDRVVVAPSTGRYGVATIAVALTIGAQVVAVGRNESTLGALCKDFDNFSALAIAVMEGDRERDYQALKSALGPHGADAFIDLSPGRAGGGGSTPSHLSAGIRALRFGGTCCLMGGIAGEVQVPYRHIMRNNIKLVGRFRCGRDHILQVIKMAESGNLPMGANIGMLNVGTYGLGQVEDALNHAERAYEASGWREIVHILPQM
jgi:threonine dehydrogenase-like Zn-dependent dehydrogenase